MFCLQLVKLAVLLWLSVTFPQLVESKANCNESSIKWAFNQDDVSPCDVANALDRVCFPGDDYPDPRTTGQQYSGPSEDDSNACLCSSVMYSMLSACAICQGATVDTWKDYTSECKPSFVTLGSFPPGIPSGTKVPAWAFMDVSKPNIWLAGQAQAIAGKTPDLTTNPSSTISQMSTSSVSGSTASSAQTTSSTTLGSTETGKSKPQAKKTGAVVGGVLGGLAGVALIILSACYLHRRKNKRAFRLVRSPDPKEPPIIIQEKSITLYNPNDPSTFPQSPFVNPYANPPGLGAGYKGVAELG